MSSPQFSSRPMGAHMPTAGGLYKALVSGKAIECSAVQLFTASPRQWAHPPLDPKAAEAFQQAREETGIPFVIAHDSYLINLAAPDPTILEKSQSCFRGELDRAEGLGLAWVVTHMGSHLNQGVDVAIARLVESLKRVLDDTDAAGYKVGVALETTAGQGSGLGATFDELAAVLNGVGPHPRLGVCLDTCHIFAAGYDLRTAEAYEETWAAFDQLIGYDRLKVIHANDAKKPLGSRVDRHEHIGEGEIGYTGFARLMTDLRLSHVPVIVETPDSEEMHAVNLRRLRCLEAGLSPEAWSAGEAVSLELHVTVQLFGHYSDYAPEPLAIVLAEGATVRHVVDHLASCDARFKDVARYCRFAVGEEYADIDAPLTNGCAVAVLPPMSGG